VFGISGNWSLLFGGLLLIVTLIQNPDGIAGTTYRKWQLRKKAALAADGGRDEPSRLPARASAMAEP
jgi:hypothetical protein